MIGSGNFTTNGLFTWRNAGNVEGAIATEDNLVILEFKEYYSEILSDSESLDIFYDKITESYDQYIDEVTPNLGCEISSLIGKNESKSKYRFTKSKDDGEIEIPQGSEGIYAYNIPQFSNFDDGTYRLVEILAEEGNSGLTFNELGELLEGPGKNEVAYKKYGENHAKLAELLDFATITNTRPRQVFLTKLGKIFYKSESSKKISMLKSQIYRMAIVKDIIVNHTNDSFNLKNYLMSANLKESTAIRRMPNIRTLFKFLQEHNVSEVESVLKKLI